MKILHVSTYPPQACGIATYTKYFVNALDREGVKSVVAAPEKALGPNVFTGYDPGHPSTRKQLLNLSKTHSTDLVHIQHEYGLFGEDYGLEAVPLILKLALNDVPVVTTLHTVYESLEREQEIILNSILKGSDRVVVHEEYQKQTLQETYPDELTDGVRVIPHGAREQDPVPKARDKLGLDHDENIILLIGYFRPTKNFEQIIRILPQIIERCPNSRLILASQLRNGEYEPYRDKLEHLIETSPVRDRITVIDGEIPQDRFDTIISASDVMALPYEVISQSGIMAHAFAFGKPMVTSDSTATRQILDASGAGFPCSSDRDYVEAVTRLFQEDVLYKRLSLNACRYVEEEIGWSVVARRYRSLYRRITTKPNAGRLESQNGHANKVELADDHLSL